MAVSILTPPPATTHWHLYHAPDDRERLVRTARRAVLPSTGVLLHVDVYAQPRGDAPVLVLNHGGGGHAGLFATLALAFFELGYTVLVPDQRGQGRSGGAPGDFTIDEAVRNIVDVVSHARGAYPLAAGFYLAGSSIGAGLTYAAAAALARAGAPVQAIACVNFYDFADPRTALAFSHFAPLARVPGLPRLLQRVTAGLARLLPGLRLPYRPMANFRAMLDERDASDGRFEVWQRDPFTLRSVTLRYLASLMGTRPAVALEDNRDVPVLVMNPVRDRMVAPAVTLATWERLGGAKDYVEIDHGHFSLQPAFRRTVATLADVWFRRHRTGSVSPRRMSPMQAI